MLANEGAGEATKHSASQNRVSPGKSKNENSIADPPGQVKPVLKVSPLFLRIFQPAQPLIRMIAEANVAAGNSLNRSPSAIPTLRLRSGSNKMQSNFKPEGDQFGPLARGTNTR